MCVCVSVTSDSRGRWMLMVLSDGLSDWGQDRTPLALNNPREWQRAREREARGGAWPSSGMGNYKKKTCDFYLIFAFLQMRLATELETVKNYMPFLLIYFASTHISHDFCRWMGVIKNNSHFITIYLLVCANIMVLLAELDNCKEYNIFSLISFASVYNYHDFCQWKQ